VETSESAVILKRRETARMELWRMMLHPQCRTSWKKSELDSRAVLKRNEITLNRYFALAYCLSMIFSDLASPAEASLEDTSRSHGFAQAGNRYPLFRIML
jgi:hypothetical protein